MTEIYINSEQLFNTPKDLVLVGVENLFVPTNNITFKLMDRYNQRHYIELISEISPTDVPIKCVSIKNFIKVKHPILKGISVTYDNYENGSVKIENSTITLETDQGNIVTKWEAVGCLARVRMEMRLKL